MHYAESSSKIESKRLELSKDELSSYVKLGYFVKHKKHDEHITIQPCWINNAKGGISAELSSSLGKWNKKLEGYLVGYDKAKLKTSVANLNADHMWIHIDITATFYVYSPVINHQLPGTIQKIGNAAAMCTVFNVFSCTVFASGPEELSSWSVGEEISFYICSFKQRRKGPILRGRSVLSLETSESFYETEENLNESFTDKKPNITKIKVKTEPIQEESDWETEPIAKKPSQEESDWETTPKKAKKAKKKIELSQEESDWETTPNAKKAKKKIEFSQEESDSEAQSITKKAKKKKKKSREDTDEL